MEPQMRPLSGTYRSLKRSPHGALADPLIPPPCWSCYGGKTIKNPRPQPYTLKPYNPKTLNPKTLQGPKTGIPGPSFQLEQQPHLFVLAPGGRSGTQGFYNRGLGL